MDNSRHHFLLPSKDGYLGVSLNQEEIKAVNDLQKKYPEKYKGAEGVLQALVDFKKGRSD